MWRDELAARLLVALEQRDDLAMASVLNPDALMLIDSGDETGGELRGRARVSRELGERLAKHPDASLLAVHVNGAPGVALRTDDGEVVAVLGIDAEPGGSIGRLWLTSNPAKLAHWNEGRPERE